MEGFPKLSGARTGMRFLVNRRGSQVPRDSLPPFQAATGATRPVFIAYARVFQGATGRRDKGADGAVSVGFGGEPVAAKLSRLTGARIVKSIR